MGEKKNDCKVFLEKNYGKRSLERPRQRQEGKI
jgi:hypothetical protein